MAESIKPIHRYYSLGFNLPGRSINTRGECQFKRGWVVYVIKVSVSDLQGGYVGLPYVIRVCRSQIYKAGMFGARYVWILPAWATDAIFESVSAAVPCSAAELQQAYSGAFSLGPVGIHHFTAPSVSGRTATAYRSELLARVTSHSKLLRLADQAYDAVLAIGLALNETQRRLAADGRYCTQYPLAVLFFIFLNIIHTGYHIV